MIPTHELSGVRYGGAEASDMDEMAAFLDGVFRVAIPWRSLSA
jgi:hypothetical protein